MHKKEKVILKAVTKHNNGLLSPHELISVIAKGDKRAVENLVAMKYIEEVPRENRDSQGSYYTINFYRATEKGILKFHPWYKKVWYFLRGDVRTIIVSIITALITTAITIFLKNILVNY